jgi:hypothetical protein
MSNARIKDSFRGGTNTCELSSNGGISSLTTQTKGKILDVVALEKGFHLPQYVNIAFRRYNIWKIQSDFDEIGPPAMVT